ncbi:MAG TPA: hypothetical protein VK694_02050 [Verrucomicrobiae bacterium]|nr:hypothetical protein [Verrucomicrobiae bacterium]
MNYTDSLVAPEAITAPETVYHANNLEIMSDLDRLFWQESEIVNQPDGRMTMTIIQRPLEKDSELADDVEHGQRIQKDQEDEVYENFGDCVVFEQRSKGPLGSALRLFGMHLAARRQDGLLRYDVTVSDVDSLNDTLDEVRVVTGFAPTAKWFEGDQYTHADLERAIEEKTPIVAIDPSLRMHDTLTHLPAWLMLSEITMDAMSARVVELRTAVERARASGHEALLGRTQGDLTTYLNSVDTLLSTTTLLEEMEGTLTSQEGAAGKLAATMKKLTGNPDDRAARRHAKLALRRVHQLTEMKHSRN